MQLPSFRLLAKSQKPLPRSVKLPDYQCNLLWALVNYWK